MDGMVLRRERMKGLRRMDLGVGVEEVLGGGMVLRGKQEVVLKMVMSEGVEKILVVVRTGRGKSLMWMMPCLMGKGGGVTVVVVPLKSLMDGVKGDCEKMGLACLV
jgi:superfamily II DNA helicase RecQ